MFEQLAGFFTSQARGNINDNPSYGSYSQVSPPSRNVSSQREETERKMQESALKEIFRKTPEVTYPDCKTIRAVFDRLSPEEIRTLTLGQYNCKDDETTQK